MDLEYLHTKTRATNCFLGSCKSSPELYRKALLGFTMIDGKCVFIIRLLNFGLVRGVQGDYFREVMLTIPFLICELLEVARY